MKKEKVYIGLGVNVAPRLQFLQRAFMNLKNLRETEVIKMSSVYETSAIGPKQKKFLNMVACLRTSFDPAELLNELKKIETRLGRVYRKKWGPREIDLDILLYGKVILKKRNLVIPHPLWEVRKFVLKPLLEVSPSLKDPCTGRGVKEIFRELTDNSQRIRLYRKGLSTKRYVLC